MMFTKEQLKAMAVDLDEAARALEGMSCGPAWDNVVAVRQAIYDVLQPMDDEVLYPETYLA